MVYSGEVQETPVQVNICDYTSESVDLRTDVNPKEVLGSKGPNQQWVVVNGVHDPKTMEILGESFEIHPLVMEDIMSTDQRPKVEEYQNHLYIVLSSLSYIPENHSIGYEQVSIILGENFVLTFFERPNEITRVISERLKVKKGRLRNSGVDFLAYMVLDLLVDNYFEVLFNLGTFLEDLETQVVEKPTENTVSVIHKLKRELILFRRMVWPLREVLNRLQREETSFVTGRTIVYLKDVYDHSIQVIDTVESFRDLSTGLLDVYLTSVSNKMNEVMKVLTIASTILLPLTFLTGLYGMNFQYMPELGWQWAYPTLWLVMIGVVTTQVFLFRKMKWL